MNSNNTTTNGDRRTKRPSNRPAMQIYRPPGLRNGEDATNTKPTPTAGAKQLKKEIIKRHNEDLTTISENTVDRRESVVSNDLKSLNPQELFGAPEKICSEREYGKKNNNEANKCGITNGTLRKKSADDSDGSLPRADSALSNESTTSSQASQRSGTYRSDQLNALFAQTNKQQHLKRSVSRISPASSPKVSQNGVNTRGTNEHRTKKEATSYTKSNSNVSSSQKDTKRKPLTPQQIAELAVGLRKLDLAKENALIEQFITSDFGGEESGAAVGQMLVQYSIEENRQAGKAVARIAAQLLDSGAAQSFHQGTVTALAHYFECRDRLRIDHFRVWIAFLNFVSDLYSNIGYIYEGELVNLVFRIFDYLLKAPVLETLKIEELESLIGCLLSAGYDLERQCPEQLAVLKDLIRDAFVEVQEPWARKMILLLMELGASGWKLPPEANEYYFQQTSS